MHYSVERAVAVINEKSNSEQYVEDVITLVRWFAIVKANLPEADVVTFRRALLNADLEAYESKIITRYGLKDASYFDKASMSIIPREAPDTEPAERLYEALCNAGFQGIKADIGGSYEPMESMINGVARASRLGGVEWIKGGEVFIPAMSEVRGSGLWMAKVPVVWHIEHNSTYNHRRAVELLTKPETATLYVDIHHKSPFSANGNVLRISHVKVHIKRPDVSYEAIEAQGGGLSLLSERMHSSVFGSRYDCDIEIDLSTGAILSLYGLRSDWS